MANSLDPDKTVWIRGARWLSGRVSDSGARGPGFETYRRLLCPWARHFTPRKYWLITQEAMAPSRYDWKIVDWDVKPQHNQPTNCLNSLNNNIVRVTSWENLFMPYAYTKKGADQPEHPCSLIIAFVIHCLGSIIPLVSISEISSFCGCPGRFVSYLVANSEDRLIFLYTFSGLWRTRAAREGEKLCPPAYKEEREYQKFFQCSILMWYISKTLLLDLSLVTTKPAFGVCN